MIIGISSLSVVYLTATPRKEFSDSPISKLKIKAVSHIIEIVINTLRRNIRLVQQIENSLLSSEDKV